MFKYLLIAGLLVPNVLLATECENDSDCGVHEVCSRADVAVGAPCYVDEDGNEICPEPSHSISGECVPGPISCETDEDCPGISSCVERPGGTTVNDGPEDEGSEPCDPGPCEEPATRTCEYVPAACQTDADCAEGLACTDVTPPCVSDRRSVPDCAEGDDCPEPEEVPEAEDCTTQEPVFQCMPQQINCETDDQCPSDWTCESIVVGAACSGSGGSGSSPGEPVEPTDSDASEPSDGESGSSSGGGAPPQSGEDGDEVPSDNEEEQQEPWTNDPCVEEVVMFCMPEGYEHYQGGPGRAESIPVSGGGDAASTGGGAEGGGSEPSDTDERDDNATSSDNESSDSGCSVGTSSGLGVVWAFILCTGLVRRRRLN